MTHIWTIPPNAPFLPELATGLIEQLGGEFAQALILMPSRRACLNLRDTFLDMCGPDQAMLLPRLQPIADAGSDELPSDFDDTDIPPIIDPLRRQLLLAKLVRAMKSGITEEHAIRLAADLASFLDEMQTEDVALEALQDLVPEALAQHWQDVLKFLGLLGDHWPKLLAGEGTIDKAERRRLLLDATARRWASKPPQKPVIAAGITGTIPAVARLMSVIAKGSRNHIVLPGLDMTIDETSWQAVAKAPTHPQFGLHRLLQTLEIERSDVRFWRNTKPSARTNLISDVMRPARTSDVWQSAEPPPNQALQGLEIAEMRDFAAEAELLCLRMREALSHQDRKVALVTSDRYLARRVSAELGRYNIEVDDSGGIPLDQTPPGSFLLLSARAITEGLAPVGFLSLLKHPLAQAGDADGQFRRLTRLLERSTLRGPRRTGGFPAFRQTVVEVAGTAHGLEDQAAAQLVDWLDRMAAAAQNMVRLVDVGSAQFTDLLDAHLHFAEWLAMDDKGTPDQLWAKEAGAAAADFISRLRAAAIDFEPIAVSAYPALLAVLMGTISVYPQRRGHPRAAILGQLESRLMDADVVLVAGLNEGVWPRPPEASPWLNRHMRQQLGLPAAEQTIGIAAHDFSQALSAKQVLLSRARKDRSGAPTTASRWLSRLDAVLRAKGKVADVAMSPNWQHWVAKPLAVTDPKPVARPEPCPPLSARPSQFWVTDVEMLMRNAYQFYARRILDLRELDPLDAEPGAAERGQIIHAALEDFVRAYPNELPAEPLPVLIDMGRRYFERFAANPQVWAIWWPKFLQIGEWFLAQERQRRQQSHSVLAERTGRAVLEGRSGRFTLMARADRIELSDREFAIVDYKTGQIPKAQEVASGLKPQLPLTALIAEADGFEGVNGLGAAELLYWGLKGGDEAGRHENPLQHHDLAEVIRSAHEGIIQLIDHFRDPKTAYPAIPRPEIAGLDGAFEHLARHKEWLGNLAVRGDRK